MVATLLHPSAVPITIPSTSPMAHPVKQCSVAEKAVRLSELFQVAITSSLCTCVDITIYPYRVPVKVDTPNSSHRSRSGFFRCHSLQYPVYYTPLLYTEKGGVS